VEGGEIPRNSVNFFVSFYSRWIIDLITAERIYDAAIRIQVCEKNLEVDFSLDQVRMYPPPKRVLALSYSVRRC